MTSKKLSYEDACRIVTLSFEDVKGRTIEEIRDLLRQRQKEAGWTTFELSEEAARRMRLRIEQLRKQENT